MLIIIVNSNFFIAASSLPVSNSSIPLLNRVDKILLRVKMLLLVSLVLIASGISVRADNCFPGSCPDNKTCCDVPPPGLYSCCPLPSAVCCSDGLHCCPANTVCNLTAGTCDLQNNKLIPILNPKPPVTFQAAIKAKINVCPGGKYYCPDDTSTCCWSAILHQYRCCPYSPTVCCILLCCQTSQLGNALLRELSSSAQRFP